MIPNGLATKLGIAGTALLAVVAALQPLLEHGAKAGKHAEFYAALATLAGVATILGRMAQAVAQQRDAPSPAQLEDDAVELAEPDDDDLDPEPDLLELQDVFPEDPPDDNLRRSSP